MARQVNLKPFYLGLAALGVAGAGGIWWAKSQAGGSGPAVVDPAPVAGDAFEGYVLGSEAAPVEIVEYADFQCPACAHFAILTGPDVKQRLVATGQVRWRFMDFPLPMHPHAPAAHLAAACAAEQGRFWPMHDQLFFQQSDWSSSRRPERRFREYAGAIGLDVARYDACMEERRYAGRIQATKEAGVARGVGSTPTFVVGNLMVSGSLPYDSLKTLVERVQRRASP